MLRALKPAARSAVFALVALAVDCGGGSVGDRIAVATQATEAPTTSTTAPKPATTAPVVPNMKPEEIAVRNLLEVFAVESTAAYEDPDPERASLLDLLTGEFKQHMVANLTAWQASGELARRAEGGVSRHETRTILWPDANTAVASECWLDDMAVYKRGEGPTPIAGTLVAFQTTVVREADRRWRIARQVQRDAPDTNAFCMGF